MADTIPVYHVVPDANACEMCRALKGYYAPQIQMPPYHPNCKCTYEVLDAAELGGEFIILQFSASTSLENAESHEYYIGNFLTYDGSGPRNDSSNYAPATEDQTETWHSDQKDFQQEGFDDDMLAAFVHANWTPMSPGSDAVTFTAPAGASTSLVLREVLAATAFSGEKILVVQLEGVEHRFYFGHVTGWDLRFHALELESVRSTPVDLPAVLEQPHEVVDDQRFPAWLRHRPH